MLSSLSFHYSPLSISSVSVGDEPFICGGRAFILPSPRGPCLLVGPTPGQKKTTVEKNKRESTNMLITWALAERYCI